MKVLALDTSTLTSTCAVISNGEVIGEYSLNQDMSHSERLVPMIENILNELKIDISEIDLYGVSTGPGSFTGLRIGAATIKGFAHVFDKPVVGVSTIKGLAYNLPFNKIVVPILDARRDRVYTGIYSWVDDEIETILEPDVMNIEILMDKLEEYENIVMNGNGISVYGDRIKDRFGNRVNFAKLGQNQCRAVSIAQLALQSFDKGKVDDYYTLAPEYLRVSQAERELKKGE